jgi:hypothetical protein
MTENEQTKICPLCAETIKAAARVCPYCRKNQRRGLFLNRFDLIGAITALLMLATFLLLARMFTEGRSFSSNRDKIEVISSKVAFQIKPHYTNIVVSGILTNRSNYSWQIRAFEIRFFDGSGKIIDADEGWPDSRLTVLPDSDHSFRFRLDSRKSIPEHASYKVMVRSANDPSIPFAGN